MTAISAKQKQSIQQFLRAIGAVSPLRKAKTASKIYEVFLLTSTVKAVADIARSRGKTHTVWIVDGNNQPRTQYVCRGGPGFLRTNNATHLLLAVINNSQKAAYEFHGSVRWFDKVNAVAHEADVSVVRHQSYALPQPPTAVQASLLLSIECKYWGRSASLGVAREAESFSRWMPTNCHVLISNRKENPSVTQVFQNYFRRRTAGYFYEVADPGSKSTQHAITRLANYLAASGQMGL